MKNKKLLIILSGIFIIIISLIIFFFSKEKKNLKVNDNTKVVENYVTESSDIIFSNVSGSIMLGDVVPTLDKFGVMNNDFKFTIKNISNNMTGYTLKLADNNSTIMNKMIRYELVKNNKRVGVFTLADNDIIDIDRIDSNEEISYAIKIWLDYNSDVKVGSLNKKISVEKSIEGIDKSGASKPILLDNMIPVYYDKDTMTYYKCDVNNSFYYSWYNYDNKLWANAVTVNGDKRDYYLKSDVGTEVNMKDINAMFVWIPRFNYHLIGNEYDIIFVNKNMKAYSAFTFNNQELDGFWVSKFEIGLEDDSDCFKTGLTSSCNNSNGKILFKPNKQMINKITMANIFYSIRKMELKNNIYGFDNKGTRLNNDGTISNDSNNFDTHMIKNSEWQALLILGNSKYGNNNILPNNTNITGMAYENGESINYNVGNGVKASTTSNVSGVYDLVGGKREYVMLNNLNSDIFSNKSNSGFSGKVKDYYYDNGLSDDDKKILELNKDEFLINDEPVTRGGYKILKSSLYSIYGPLDYVGKISLESSSRAVLIIGG